MLPKFLTTTSVRVTSEMATFHRGTPLLPATPIPPPRTMESTQHETRISLALEALRKDKILSVRAAAKIYNVQRSTLQNRRVGKPARRDIPANSRKLTDLEEKTITDHVIELSARSFPPRLRGVEDMPNQLLRARDAPCVGKHWASNFVKR